MPIFVLLLLASTAAYSVVNAARSTLPERAERTSCSARIASFCSVYGTNVCNAIVPQSCGAMQSSESRGEQRHEHSVFYILSWILLGVVFVEFFRRHKNEQALLKKDFVHYLLFQNEASSPLLVGGLSSLRL
ncbi:MAG: hypothetical protein Q7S09_00430 [bacterium]|nr:hypothetical protein [bacterium]